MSVADPDGRTRSTTLDPVTPPAAVCYRHPQTLAGVTCQRCDQPVCPACMRQASVGFHCPDCVAAAAASSPRLSASALTARRDVVTTGLIGANVVVFVLALISTSPVISGVSGGFYSRYGLRTFEVAMGEWWRTITSGFLHSGAFHLMFNMWALYQLGRALERHLGAATFGALYALGLAGGSLGVVALASPSTLTVGASGAIFGLMGALVAFDLLSGRNPMDGGVGTVVLLNLGITFLVPGISIGGHVGGLVAGAVGGAMVGLLRRSRVPDPAIAGVVAGVTALVLVGAVVLAPLRV